MMIAAFSKIICASQKVGFHNVQLQLIHHCSDLFFISNVTKLVVLSYWIDMADKTLHVDRQARVVSGLQTLHECHVEFGIRYPCQVDTC